MKMNKKDFPQSPVSVQTAATIQKLTEQLRSEFGCDFAFTIMGKGHCVACSNMYDGIIDPKIKS